MRMSADRFPCPSWSIRESVAGAADWLLFEYSVDVKVDKMPSRVRDP